MMRGRRPAKGLLVENLQGSAEAKKRLRLILDTLTGDRSIQAAGAMLGMGKRRFHDLRRHLLEDALQCLEPRPRGRPAPEQPDDEQVARLEEEIQKLRMDLTAARVREELALAMPHLLDRSRKAKKPPHRRARSSPIKRPGT